MECDLRTGVYEEEEEDDEDWTDTQWGDPENQHRVTLLNDKPTQHSVPPLNDKPRHRVTPLNDKPTQHKTINNNTTTNVKIAEQTQIHNDTGVVKSMLLNDNKAGMTGLDKDRINQIIHEASKGSKFYENERQKEEKMKKRIEEQRKKILTVSTEQLTQGTLEADRLLEDFEQQRDLSRCIVHIDMDAFYAAVEMRDDPSLKDKPMAVGGSDMLSTSNYAARKFGVRAAMPGFIAKKLCPELVIVPTNFDKYTAVSKQVKAIMAEYDPNFCPMSLDEAYLDFTDHLVKRQNMKQEERTVICRDSNYAFSKEHCICDLNSVIQYQDLLSCSTLSGIKETNSANFEPDNIETNNSSYNVPINEVSCVKTDSSISSINRLCADCGKPLPPYSCVVYGLSDEDAVSELRMRIQQRTRLTASAGIAPNMMLSKVCSDKNKPNGQYKIPFTRAAVMEFIQDLPTRKISGIGKVSEAMLNALGVHTCTDLYDKRGLLYHLYSSISFNYFMRICLGIGSTTVERDSERKSMSTERTFTEINKNSELFTKLEELSSSLSEDLKAEQLKGKTVSIKIKTVNFQVRTRAHTVKEYTNDYDDILQAATDLLKTEIKQAAPHPLRLRLMGVRMSNLIPERLCQKTKQKTIIGAFKQLTKAKNEGTDPLNNTAVDENKLDNIEEGVQHELVDISKMCATEIVTLIQHHGNKIAPHHGYNGAPSSENTTKNVQVEHENCLTLDLADSGVVTQDSEMKSGSLDSGCNENTSTRICGVSDINNLTPFGGKSCVNRCTDIIDKHDTEHTRHTNLHSTKVITGLDVKQGDSKHCASVKPTESVLSIKQLSTIYDVSESMSSMNKLSECVLTSNDLSKNVSTINDLSESVTMENKKPEMADHKQNMESVPPSPVIVHSDETNCRVTRSGQVGTPVPGRKSRKRSGRTKTLEQYECPVCAKTVLCKNLQSFNQHVDVCLSSEPVGLKSPDKMQSPDKPLTETKCTKPLINNELCENKSEVNDDLKPKESTEHLPSCAYDSEEQLTCSFKNNIDKNEVKSETLKVHIKEKYLSEKTELMSGLKLDVTKRQHDDNEFDRGPPCTDTSPNSSDKNSVVNGDKASIGNIGAKCSHFGKLAIPPPEQYDNLKEPSEQLNKESTEHSDKKSPEQFVTDDKCFMSDSNKTMQTDSGSTGDVNISIDMNDTHTGYMNEADDDDDHKNHIDREFMELESVKYTDGEQNLEDRIEDNSVVAAGMSVLSNSAEPQNASLGRINNEIGVNHAFARDCSDFRGSRTISSSISGVNVDKPDHTDSYEQSDEDSSEENGSLLVCPVCNVGQRSADLNKFNEHVDVCLSRGAITELVKEQNKIDKNTLKRSMTTPTSSKPSKKRRTIMPDVPSKSCRSIASFFQTK